MSHRMSPPDTTITGVGLGDTTVYADAHGVFLIPDEHAADLAAQGWTTLDDGEKPPVGFTSARDTKSRTRNRKTTDTTEKETTDE